MLLFLTILTLLLAFAVVAWMLILGRGSEAPAPSFTPPDKSEMSDHLVWKLFYANPEDPRGWVPKVSGFGYTVNFRTPGKAKAFAILIAATLLSALAQTGFITRGFPG